MAGLKHTGIIDSDKREMLNVLDRAAGERASAKRYLDEQFSHNIFAINGYINTVDSIARLGRPLSWQEFEDKLRKLPFASNLVFGEFSVRPFRCVSYRKPDGTIVGISSYGRVPAIPEFSTMNVEREAVPDFNIRRLDARDFSDMEWKGDRTVGLDNINQPGYQMRNGKLKPGWIYRDKFVGENPMDPYSRGWRTVLSRGIALAQLKQIQFASPDAIDRVFGGTDSPQWAKHTGRQQIISPF